MKIYIPIALSFFFFSFFLYAANSKIEKKSLNSPYAELSGTVSLRDVRDWDRFFDLIEEANPKNFKDFRKISSKVGKELNDKRQTEKIKIILHNASFQKVEKVNSYGGFRFNNIPYGTYTLESVIPNIPVVSQKSSQTITDSVIVKIDQEKVHVDLFPNPLSVIVSGYVRDSDSQPIEGAEIIISESNRLNMETSRQWIGVSNAKGYYKINKLPPEDTLSIFRLLSSDGEGEPKGSKKIWVKTNGYSSAERNIGMLSENVLYVGRRLFKILSRIEKRPDNGLNYIENTKWIFPSSKGNEIYNIDFILNTKDNSSLQKEGVNANNIHNKKR